jgi:hypothetical protein
LVAFVPIGLLLLASLGIALMQRLRPSVGWSWLAGSTAALAAFVVMLLLRWRLPQQVIVSSWLPFSQFTDSPIFALDGTSWPYAFCLTAMILAVMLTASARLGYQINPWAWTGALLTVALGLLAVYSANFLTIALAWTAIDLLEVIILSGYSPNRVLGVQAVIAFAARVTGMALVILAALVNRSQGFPPTFSALPALSALFLLLASGLRLGVLPLNLPMLPDLGVRRGLGTVLRMSGAAASLVVLARLPAQTFSPRLTALLLVMTVLGVLYAVIGWLNARNEITARPYWVIALAGFAVFSTLRGDPVGGMAWGTAALLSGSIIFLYSARSRLSWLLPVLGLIGFSTLPFTPAAAGWVGLMRQPWSGWEIFLLPAHLLLLLGYLRHAFHPGDELRNMERWIQTAYPAGLILLIAAQWVIGLIGWPGSLSVGVWWAALYSGGGLAVTSGVAVMLRRRKAGTSPSARFYRETGQKAARLFTRILSLNWLYNLLWLVFRRVEQGLQIVNEMLEGEGGLLWVFVLLALFVSLLQVQVTR